MNLKALITSLVLLGSSQAAVAKPLVTFSAEASVQFGTRYDAPRPVVRDHRNRVVTPVVRDHRDRVSPPIVREQRTYTTRPNTMYDYDRNLDRTPPRYVEPLYDGEINLIIGGDASSYNGRIFELANTRRASWTALTEPTRIEKGREFIHLNAAGPVRDLMFQSVAGRTSITHVSIQFADNTTQVVQINQTLSSRNATIDLPLDGRQVVTRIVVYGTSSTGSAYRVLGR